MQTPLARRAFLIGVGRTTLGLCVTSVLSVACTRTSQAQAAAIGPAGTGALCTATAANIEGPYFKPGAPVRSVLVTADDAGERFVLSGRVVGPDCKPVAGARIEFWHADAHGAYDNEGMHFRCTVHTNARGEWELHTIVPGRYLNGRKFRPAHIHAKVHSAGRPILTTQLYFEGDPENEGDPFIVASLIMGHRLENGVRRAHFDFALA